MTEQIKISNPTSYTRTEDKKVMASWKVQGSKEAMDLLFADQCKDAGREVSKDEETGNPVFRLTFETAYNYGATNTLTRAIGQDGSGIWISENNALIKLEASLLADPTVSDDEKADIKAGQLMKKDAFRALVAKNTTARTTAWIAKQPARANSNDPFTKVK